MNYASKSSIIVMVAQSIGEIIAFIAVLYLVSGYFNLEVDFLIKLGVIFYIARFFISSLVSWITFFLVGKSALVFVYEFLFNKFFESIQDNFKRSMSGPHRVILETSIEDNGLSPEFRIMLAKFWGNIENAPIQARFKSAIAWRTALSRHRLLHPQQFAKDETDIVFAKGPDARWQSGDLSY